MPITAHGIWTPSDTDAVDFTTDLATMAGTIDNALSPFEGTGWVNLFPAAGVTGTVRYRVLNRVVHFEVDVTVESVPANEVKQIATGVPPAHRPTVLYSPLNMFRGGFFQDVAPGIVSASSGTLSVRNPVGSAYAGRWMGTGSYALP